MTPAATKQSQENMNWIFSPSAFLLLVLSVSLFAGCSRQTIYEDPIPKHDEFNLDSNATGDTRRINVYLPPTYEKSDTKYPVVYMPDGGIKEDFPHIANTLNSLIEENAIAPVILVGVENTIRTRDLTSKSALAKDSELIPINGGSANFRDFFRDELRPEIEKRYRCAKDTAIVGESAAGLFVVETLIVEPTLFDRYIAFDPSLWWNDSALVTEAEKVVATKPFAGKRFWFASSDAEGMKKRNSELDSILKSKSNQAFNFKYTHCPKEQHSTIFRSQKVSAFKWTLWEK